MPVDETELAAVDEQFSDLQLIDVVLTARSGFPVRKVVRELRSGRIDLEVEMRIVNVDAIDLDLPSPERLDAAGDVDFANRREVGIQRAGRIRDAQIAKDHFLRSRAKDLQASDRDRAAEAQRKRLRDALGDEILE